MQHNLYNWVFTKNTYRNIWRATNRENLISFWDNSVHSIESSKIESLIEIIEKFKGDITEILKWKNADIKE